MIENSKYRADGFTLLELSMVIFLMAIMLGFSLPRFSSLFDSELKQETQKIARLIKELRLEAILKGKKIKIVFDTKNSQISILTTNPENPAEFVPHQAYTKPIQLPESIEIIRVTQDSAAMEDVERRFSFEKIEFDKIFGQTYEFYIDSSGFIDLFKLELKNQSKKVSLSVRNIMGKIDISEETSL